MNPNDVAAEEAFKAVNAAHTVLTDLMARAAYDESLKRGAVDAVVIKTKDQTYADLQPLAAGHLSKVYVNETYLVKVAVHPSVNALLKHEFETLKLFADKPCTVEASKLLVLAPVETALVKDGRSSRQIAVYQHRSGFITLEEVVARYPGHFLDPRHAVWLGNRLFPAVAMAHEHGIVHTAVQLPHVLVKPDTHAVIVAGWGTSVKVGETVKRFVKGFKPLYAPEALRAIPISPATDVYNVAQVLHAVSQPLPPKLARVLNACLIHNPSRRIQSAWEAFDLWSEAAAHVYGPRKFVPLEL